MVNINGLHKNIFQKPEDGTDDTAKATTDDIKTPQAEARSIDDDFSRSKSLAINTQTKKPQLAKSTFNLKEKTPQLPQKINYSGYGLNPNRQRSASTADPNGSKGGPRKKVQAEPQPEPTAENIAETYNGKIDTDHL